MSEVPENATGTGNDAFRMSVALPDNIIEAIAERAAVLVLERLELPASSTTDGWVSVDDLAKRLGWSRWRVYRWRGRLPHRKVGGRLMFSMAEVEAELERYRGDGPI